MADLPENQVSYNTFYYSWHDAMSELTDEQYGRLSRALNEYCFFGTAPKLSGIEKTIFTMAIPSINASTKAKKDGKKGGRPTSINHPLNPPFENSQTPVESNGNGNGNGNVYGKEKEKGDGETGLSFSGFNNQNESEPPPDQPSQTEENAITVFNKARILWNELKINPQCRDIIIPPAEYDCLRAFQNYSWAEIENAIKNFKYHLDHPNGWKTPPPYGSIYGFLKTGVAKYHDDDAFEQMFREKG